MTNAWLSLNGTLTSEQQLQLEDQSLVANLQTGDSDAYERLIQRFQTPVYNLAWRLVNDPGDAADVVQEVFLKVFRNVESFRGESSLRTWIYRITVNEAHNRRRWIFRHRRGETGLDETYGDESGSHEMPLVDAGETPFDFTFNQEARLLLEEGLATISPTFRTTLVLREIEEMSYDEIATIMDVSIGTVKSRIVRGREALRCYLSERLTSRHAAPTPAFGMRPGVVD